MNRLIFCFVVLMALAASAFERGARVKVTLRNGAVVSGRFVSETSRSLLIDTGTRTESVALTDVADIEELNGAAKAPAAAPGPAAPPTSARTTPREPAPPPPPAPPAPAAPRAPLGASESVGPTPPAPPSEPLPPMPTSSRRNRRAAAVREETSDDDGDEIRHVRFGLGVSGGALPGYYGIAWGVGAELGVGFFFNEHFSLRLLGNFTHTENGPFYTNLALAVVMMTVWFGPYGLGLAPILGVGGIGSRTGRDPGFGAAVGVLFSPVRLRFGKRVTSEISLEGGAIYITSDTVSPFARLAYTIFF
ncbi:MAG: hypothetical protein QM817_08225 [Archangium sp.]